MRKPELVLLMLFIALIGKSTFAQNSPFSLEANEHQLVTIDEIFSESTEIEPFNGQGKKIYGLAASAKIDFTSEEGLVRLVLLDNNFNEYLLLESYPNIDGSSVSFEGHAEETALLNGITPYAIEIQVKDATVRLNHLSYATKGDVISNYNKQKKEKQTAQNKDKIQRLNKNLKAKGQHWVAGETGVSQLSYAERKKLYGSSTFPSGFEFYAGGVISTETSRAINTTEKSATATSPYTDSWDWRDRHGKNWITPVTNQGGCGSCWAFASTGATEAMVNLFYNQQINMDLSEQDVLSCSNAGDCIGGMPADALSYISSQGIVDEVAFPYTAYDDPCSNKSNNPSELIKIGGRIDFGYSPYLKSEDNLKSMLISFGAISSGIINWSHAIVLVGYKVVNEGDTFYYRDAINKTSNWLTIESGNPLIGKTVWIFKNSWGPYYGDQGYVYIETPIENIGWTHAIQTPITSEVNNYEVQCTDNDGDGYYFWGLGPNQPIARNVRI
ncbi:C1 family peptidase [uncultured Draconibacterium sp.]|uniref:C1 family peptidase n=1 Tax=uncultured Draconibacterium sp. TaxID=1573823 RepID=UPI002AA73275|nr:C1 family peptidase [uncultured Draconibacterium sp.]